MVFILLFTFFLLDDALQMHERLGLRIADALALQPFGGLRPVDAGELLVWTIVGVPLVAAAVAALFGSPEEDRSNGLLLGGAAVVLAVFAVLADAAHIMLSTAFWGADILFTVLEDGGEQITLSLTCCLVILIRRELRGRESKRATPA